MGPAIAPTISAFDPLFFSEGAWELTAAVERLKKEHDAIKRMMQVAEKVSGRLKGGQAVEPEHLDQILEFFEVFADTCHHEKEEKVLFPALKEAGVPVDDGPIGILLKEHTMMRGCLERMGKAITRYKGGNQNAVSLIAQNAINHNELLLMHLAKEEDFLFRTAETRLSEAQDREVLKKYDALESETVGPERHQGFYQTLDRLETVYLKD
jgi:hemerythrin-like domain-containing protein